MNPDVLLTTLLIVLARVADVSLGTVRTVAVVNGRKGLAFALGFCEILIWVAAVSKVVTSLGEPVYAVSYALGFALGNYLGILLEQTLAFGEQVMRVFTRQGPDVAARLRAEGFGVTSFLGEGLEGPIHLLVVQAGRRQMAALARLVDEVDPACFYVIDDVRTASSARVRRRAVGAGPLAAGKRK